MSGLDSLSESGGQGVNFRAAPGETGGGGNSAATATEIRVEAPADTSVNQLSFDDLPTAESWLPLQSASAALDSGDSSGGIRAIAESKTAESITPDVMAKSNKDKKVPEVAASAVPARPEAAVPAAVTTADTEPAIQKSPADEAMDKATAGLDPTQKMEAVARITAVKPDSNTELADLQARKDSLSAEDESRRLRMIEQQQEHKLLLMQEKKGEVPLDNAQAARLKELKGAYGDEIAEDDEEAEEAEMTPEARAAEMATLRDKAKKGELDDAGKERLLKLEDDEIEAVTAEYDPSDPDSLVATAQKLDAIAESRRGYAENQTMKDTMAKVFKEWVAERANPEANLSTAEKAALKKVQELVGEMHKDLLTIINANRQIERVKRGVDKAIKATEAQEKKLNRLKDISKDDESQQKEALRLQAMYVDLLNKKAQLLGAANAARLANNSFRVKRTQVRRALGLTGFWTGLIEATGTKVRNSVGNGVSNIDTFLSGKPLAERYINERL